MRCMPLTCCPPSLQGEKPEAPSSPAQPAAVTAELQEQKHAAKVECSKLEKDISELRASLETEAAQRTSAEEILRSMRERLSGQTTETEEAQRRVVELTAEVDSGSKQAQQLQNALAAAQAEAEAARTELGAAQSHKEEAAARLEASDAAVKGLKERQADLEQQLACLQVCAASRHYILQGCSTCQADNFCGSNSALTCRVR